MTNERLQARKFTRMLTLPLLHRPDPPSKVEARTGQGFHLLLHGAAGQLLHLCFTTLDLVADAYLKTRFTAMRYLGEQRPRGISREWLEVIGRKARQLDGDTAWRAWVKHCSSLPAVALADGRDDDRRIHSGQTMVVRITGRCNARCRFCSARGLLPDLASSPEQVSNVLGRARSAGVESVSFSGGEPTLMKQLADYVALARELGFSAIDCQSNGILLADAARVRGLREAGLSSVFLSLHAGRAELHERLLQRPGCFPRVLRAIENLRSQGIAVSYNCVVSRSNYRNLGRLVEFVAGELAHSGAEVNLSFVALQGWVLDNLELVPRLAQVMPFVIRALERGRELGLQMKVPGLCGVPLCQLPGREHFCDEFHDSEPPPQQPERGYVKACGRCPFRLRCSGFWNKYYELHGSAEFGYRGP